VSGEGGAFTECEFPPESAMSGGIEIEIEIGFSSLPVFEIDFDPDPDFDFDFDLLSQHAVLLNAYRHSTFASSPRSTCSNSSGSLTGGWQERSSQMAAKAASGRSVVRKRTTESGA